MGVKVAHAAVSLIASVGEPRLRRRFLHRAEDGACALHHRGAGAGVPAPHSPFAETGLRHA